MKKKILFISEALWIGGIETALVNLLNRLDYEKYEVTLLLRRAIFDGDMRQKVPAQCRILTFDRENGQYRFARLYHLTEESENPSRLHRAMMWTVPAIRWIENRLYIRYVREQMQGEHFDTCVIYSDVAAETAVRAIRADKFLLFYHHGAMRKVWHDEIGYRKADKIIAVSGAVEQKLRTFRPKYANKMMTIHNLTDVAGIRAKGAEPIPEEFPADRFNIVSCGRVSHEKGMDLAVEACAELVKMGHENIHWWIVGGGPAEDEVRAEIARLHMEDHVTMLGMKANPYPYIRQADLYVQPSRFEGYPMTILEALILGQPVISTNNTGAQEILQDGVTGVLCEIDPGSIASGVHDLLNANSRLEMVKKFIATLDLDKGNRAIIAEITRLFEKE